MADSEVLPGHLAIATKQAHATFKYPQEVIERCLYEVAACGGNRTAALRNLQSENVELQERGEDEVKLPPVRTLRHWITGPFRNRYHEICADGARTLEEVVAAQGVENAIAMGKAEADALAQTLAGLSNANGVEASTILRNISQAKGTAVQTSQLLRGRPTAITVDKTLQELGRELESMGVAKVIDGTAVEIAPDGSEIA